MLIDLIVTGKTDAPQVAELVELYRRRINRYVRCNIITLADLKTRKNLSPGQQNREEGERLLASLLPGDYVALLDEQGGEYRSIEFAAWLQQRMNAGVRRLVFVVGGPYGFSQQVVARADARISLSQMTFSHQIVRVLFAEQLYRAFTILHGEPYHHE